MAISGKTVVITGSSSGIGAEAARQLAQRGARVCLVARRKEELKQVQDSIAQAGGQAWVYPADLTDEQSLGDCADAILADHARIDVLVNNAAHSIRRPITEAMDRLHDYQRTININYIAAVGLTLRFLPRMLEQGEGQVVNISTLSSQVPIPLFSAYLASKSALESFSRSLLAELGHKGIGVSVVYFPMVRTPMSARTQIYKRMPMMDVEKAAGWIVRAIDKRSVRVGSPLGTLGSVALAALPGPVTRLTQPAFRQMDKLLKRASGRS
ncbi:SDR family NAD(P)-dependent oxidoreductase [Marinobacter pelagius]|uniref:SDR family NAD(P)-dependent oxidoreductase n=1 Tax=Marinobacter sp. C7 TaxID=2951363 RepID=UPI001EEFB16F|nr:SDR family NAD(P)-dependent oxidoreductase [Marinobacter sp. C7]MCG7198841.1 SDR family NAD(P)-dependent oxidoreductase [Marinobacter sp. C7]